MFARSIVSSAGIRGAFLGALACGLTLIGSPISENASGQQPVNPQPVRFDRAAIDRAIQQGVSFLRKSQHPQGHWGDGTGPNSDKGWAVGYTCLAGLALAECGVSTSDPGLRLAASGIRGYAHELDSTYEVALAILFLDRLGEKSDTKIIQMLAARLIAAQTPTGGWGYKTPKYSSSEGTALLQAIRRFSPPFPPASLSVRERPGSLALCIKASEDTFFRAPAAFDPSSARRSAIGSLPTKMKKLPVLFDPGALIQEDPKEKRNDPTTGTTDNSNTHFAILGLWAARRHDVPTDRTLALMAHRFRTSQGAGGSWTYDFVRGGADGAPQMTCIALLGLAIGHVINPDAAIRPEKDPKVVNAFAALTPRIGEPTGRSDNRPAIKDAGGLYFLWAMERIAVLYDVRQLDKKDWYKWGAEILVGHQAADGSWSEEGGYPGQHPILNTALALLFLKRANLTPDLSRRLSVDTELLTSKVDNKVAPKPAPTPPTPSPTPTPVVTEPPKQESPPPKRTEPTVAAAAPENSPVPPPAKSESNSGVWIALLTALALVGGGLVFFGFRKSRQAAADEDDEDEKPRRKNKKKRPIPIDDE